MKKEIVGLLCVLSPIFASAAGSSDYMADYYSGNYLKINKILQDLALQNDKEAMFYLGKMYVNGYGVQKSFEKGIELIKQSGLSGYEPAQLYLGKYYLNTKDGKTTALEWFKKAGELGSVEAQLYCGFTYLNGNGESIDENQAKYWFDKASINNSRDAQYELANLYLKNDGQEKLANAIDLLEKSVLLGNFKAQYQLGKIYKEGKLLPIDNIKAIKWFELAYKSNSLNKNLKYDLAMLYLTNNSADKAFTLLKSSATSGNVLAQYNLARLYEGNFGIQKNLSEAIVWYTKSANHGYSKAMHALAELYLQSKNEGSRELAIYWLKKASDAGDILAKEQFDSLAIVNDKQNINEEVSKQTKPLLPSVNLEDIFSTNYAIESPDNLALKELLAFDFVDNNNLLDMAHKYRLEVGDGDTSKAQSLFKITLKEAEQGYAKPQFKLAQMYEQGYGVEKDKNLAFNWYLSAAKQGFNQAKYNLAVMYLKGDGIEENAKEGLYWLESAAAANDIYANYLLGVLYANGFQSKNIVILNKDIAKAEQLYQKAVDKDLADAEYLQAKMYTEKAKIATDAAIKQELITKSLLLYKKAAIQGQVKANEFLASYYIKTTQDKDLLVKAFRMANEAASHGSAFASLLDGIMYDRGLGVEISKSNAINWYKKAVKAHQPVALYILGANKYLGNNVEIDKKIGLKLITMSAESGYLVAEYNLALLLKDKKNKIKSDINPIDLMQKSASQNYKKAKRFLADYYITQNKLTNFSINVYEKAIKHNDSDAALKLGFLYQHGIGVKKDESLAKNLYEKADSQNNFKAQYLLGNMYQLGIGSERNLQKAISYYEKALSSKYPKAQTALAFIYEADDDLAQNFDKSVRLYTSAAKAGDAVAAFNLGLMYKYGIGLKKDVEKAFVLHMQAAKQNLAEAAFSIALMYQNGIVVKKSINEAIYWYKKAAKGNNIYAQYELGLLNETGVGVPINNELAFKYYKDAFDNKYLSRCNAQMKIILALARLYDYGTGCKKDAKEAAKLYMIAAKDGSLFAKYKLAKKYETGDGVNANFAKALELFNEVADKGNANVQYKLGMYYLDGNLVPKDINKALYWLNKSSVSNNEKAAYVLADMYFNGNLVKKDEHLAASLYEKSANLGNAAAQYNLAQMYSNGQGVELDYVKAANWNIKAARAGYKDAQSKLALMYDAGIGVKQNFKEAFKWYLSSAKQGDNISQYHLGLMYFNGTGTKTDYSKAYYWLNNAYKNGNILARNQLAIMYKNGYGVKQDLKMAYELYVNVGAQNVNSL